LRNSLTVGQITGRCAGSGRLEDAGGVVVQHPGEHVGRQAEAGELGQAGMGGGDGVERSGIGSS